MFGEGPGTSEDLIKAKAEIALSEKPVNEETVKREVEDKEGEKNSILKKTLEEATEFAKHFIRVKNEKPENS